MKRFLSLVILAALLFSFATAESKLSNDYNVAYARVSKLSIEELEQLIKDIEDLIAVKKIVSNTGDNETKETDDLGIWVEKYFVDDFKEPTDEKYISTSKAIEGTFSNSAATNKDLTVKIIISMSHKLFKDDEVYPMIAFELYEYGSHKVKNGGTSEKEYIIYTRLEDGSTPYTNGKMSKNGERIYLSKSSSNAVLLQLIQDNKTIKFQFVDNNKYSKSTYNFTIEDTTGLENALKWLLGE